jgi:signal transduction histidine kinase
VLAPSAIAVLLWLVASGYLVFTGFYDHEVASTVRQVSIPAVTGLSSIQQERRLSVAHLAEPSTSTQQLIDQRRQTDVRLSSLRTVANSALSLAPASIKTRWKVLADDLDRLPGIRTMVDAGGADRQRVYDFYNGLLDAATDLFDTQARVVPDVTATQGGIAAVEIFRASDQMSRAGSIITGAFGSHVLSQDDYLQFVSLVNGYHAELTNIARHLRPDVLQRYTDLAAGGAWQNLVVAENSLIVNGRWSNGVPRALTFTSATWNTLTSQVSDALIGLTIAQADEVSAQALSTGNNQLLTALLGSLIALAVAVGAILWAVRQSRVLVDRALSVRLDQLGKDAAAVVDQRLPQMMDRIARRQAVNAAIELPDHDYGRDEIGQLADVLNRSLKVAVSAAVNEAATRAAGTAMLMGVARRPQRPLQRALHVVEELQSRIGDEALLAELFDVNHQLAQARRYLENLIILAGGHPGRRFHKPVALRRVLLATIGETQQYQRISLRRIVDVALAGNAIAGTTHLLAELLDNAVAFSPPGSVVWVSCIRATRGVVVEIEDAGVGMLPDDLERANELLATAPTPDVTALRDAAQLGLWVVAELAKRDGIQVSLRTSAYGGLLAIVLLPDRLIASDEEVPDELALVPAAERATGVLEAVPWQGVREFAAAAPANGNVRLEARPTASGIVDGADAGIVEWPLPAPQASNDRLVEDPDLTVRHERHSNGTGERPHATEPTASTASDTFGAEPHTRPPLPERRPQQHLAPELIESATSLDAAEPAPRSPEETGARFARYQQGWQAARSADAVTGNEEDGKA